MHVEGGLLLWYFNNILHVLRTYQDSKYHSTASSQGSSAYYLGCMNTWNANAGSHDDDLALGPEIN